MGHEKVHTMGTICLTVVPPLQEVKAVENPLKSLKIQTMSMAMEEKGRMLSFVFVLEFFCPVTYGHILLDVCHSSDTSF